MFNVEGLPSVAPLVGVFDVVVHERGLVKALDGHGGLAE
jgi:hypothetical protein